MACLCPTLLSDAEIRVIHETSLRILDDTGILVHHPGIAGLLAGAGARLESAHPVVHLPEGLVRESIQQAGKRYTLHGREGGPAARFGDGELHLLSTPGQQAWLDWRTQELRPATADDLRTAIRLGDALPNISVVGAMAQPANVGGSPPEIFTAAELLKRTTKPTRSWVSTAANARWVLELYSVVAGGAAALRSRPMTEGFLTPISPLQFSQDGLEVMRAFVDAGQPVCIASMPMASGTAPATLAGTLALANAEVLAGVVIAQRLRPGTAILYGGIPHLLDPRSLRCSFGAPEQGLMAVAMTELGRHHGFPVYVNVGLTDAVALDLQAGIEKGASLLLGALAGADLFGHAGICGADCGASLLSLCADDELMGHVKRVVRGLEVTPETLAADVIHAVKPGGSFLGETHTAEHLRREFWIPGKMWSRQDFAAWNQEGRTTMADRLTERVEHLLSTHRPPPLDPALACELDRIVAAAAQSASNQPEGVDP